MPNKHVRYVGTVILLLIMASLACNFNFGETEFDSVEMARDNQGRNATAHFSSDDDFYVVFDLKNAPNDTTLRAVWYAVDVDGIEPNTKLGEQEIETGSGQSYFSLANAQRNTLWSLGKYRAEVYIDGDKAKTLDFEVNIQLDEAYLSSDDAGNERTTVFPPSAMVYANVSIKDAPENESRIKIEWYDGDNKILSDELPAGTGGTVRFSLTNSALFDFGDYRAEIRLDEREPTILNFSFTVQILGQILTKEPLGEDPADVFYVGETPYVVLDIASSPENNVTVDAIWYVVGDDGRIEAGTTSTLVGTGGLVSIAPPEDLEFVEGRYIVEVFRGSARLDSVRFAFEAAPESPFAGG